jgi:DNA repair exonuclease SbcCD ATPase subunit
MTWELEIENIGGIRSGNATIESGVNTVQASNWQGKTSFIRAIETAMGTAENLQESADSGRVRLDFSDERAPVDRTLQRTPSGVEIEGEAYISKQSDQAAAALFAFLTEGNELREAVRQGSDLGDILLRPYYIEDIEAEIDRLQNERDRVESNLEEARRDQRRATELASEIPELESEIEALRSELEPYEGGEEDRSEVEKQHADATSSLEKTKRNIETLEREIEDLESELEDKQAELEDISLPDGDESEIEAELDTVAEELADTDHQLELLEDVYSANKRILDEGVPDLLTSVERNLDADTVACWVCDQETTREVIEDRVAAISEQVNELQSKQADLRSRRDELRERISSIESTRQRRRDLEDAIPDLQRQLEERKAELESARDHRETLEEEVEELEQKTENVESKRVELQSEIQSVESELHAKREELDQLEDGSSDDVDELESRVEDLTSQISDMREMKANRKQQARESFNDAMEEIVETFNPSFEGAHLAVREDDTFEVVIGRGGEEIGVDELSQGEVELVAVITALAGFEAFDVDEISPVILLDDMGGLAGDHLETLVEYLQDRTEAVVTTAYPDQEVGGNEITPQEWDVVSDQVAAD